MFWQPLGFFENSLRKQLWIPSPLLSLATHRALEHQQCPQVLSLSDLAL